MTTTTERSARSHEDKFSARRTMLAQSALTALAEHGFADTGLRDIAHYSALSHGSLHYYFDDKDDLIAEAVWAFKSTCARRYDEIVATATDCTELATQVAALMATTLRKDAALQSCSLAAQGLWMNALCIAHECEPYGHLTINGQPMTVAQLGRLVGATAREAQALVDELLVGEHDGVARHAELVGHLAARGHRLARRQLAVEDRADQHLADLRLQAQALARRALQQLLPHHVVGALRHSAALGVA